MIPHIKCFMLEPTGKMIEHGGVTSPIWKRADTGEEMTIQQAPVGAMWYVTWEGLLKGPDGKTLVVKTPGGNWVIDNRCRNCTRKDDDVHRCWIRHGTPPEITVDKNGDTCSAGAGSIQTGIYHGFLRNGYLEDA